jgi:hypothetical protein
MILILILILLLIIFLILLFILLLLSAVLRNCARAIRLQRPGYLRSSAWLFLSHP